YVIDTTKTIAGNMSPGDEAFLLRFVSADKIMMVQDMTSDSGELAASADDMYCEGGRTAIPEAVLYAAKGWAKDGKNEHKVLVLITDGDNTSPKMALADTVGFLKEKKIPVQIVGITSLLDEKIGEAKKFLERLAVESGGSVVFVDSKTSAAD